ncbi:hypothetical protein EPO04_00440 [Patescibacteria group bacterium]|nr:MAG: hypothetical protein EPO04_00440 [Patescibacteria group bacterium]
MSQQKTSRLIIQGQPDDIRRRYHLDIDFPFGHINLSPGKPDSGGLVHFTYGSFVGYWASAYPSHSQIPGRLHHIISQIARARWSSNLPLAGGIAVRTNHMRVFINKRIPANKRRSALHHLDNVVIKALGADLRPDYDSGQMWYNDPGPQVDVVRPDWQAGVNVSDPEGDRRIRLDPDVNWKTFSGERFVNVKEQFSIHRIRSWPKEQIELLHTLFWSQGSESCDIFPPLTGSGMELTLRKGLAWTWADVNREWTNRFATGVDLRALAA